MFVACWFTINFNLILMYSYWYHTLPLSNGYNCKPLQYGALISESNGQLTKPISHFFPILFPNTHIHLTYKHKHAGDVVPYSKSGSPLKGGDLSNILSSGRGCQCGKYASTLAHSWNIEYVYNNYIGVGCVYSVSVGLVVYGSCLFKTGMCRFGNRQIQLDT